MGHKIAEWLSALRTSAQEAAPDILVMNFTIVNACLVGDPKDPSGNWTLVDTGLENSAEFIIQCAEGRFGKGAKPQAIILTHGHFDHVGSVRELASYWDVPVYIQERELPYVTGQKDYPQGDASVDSGMVAKLAPTFPTEAIDLSGRVQPLPDDQSVPGMPDWIWIPAFGHTVGQVALYREKDDVLIVADAFSTTKQESLFSVMMHSERISGPPKYLTEDFEEARSTVMRLAALDPVLVISSHGEPMRGDNLTKHLETLIDQFDEIAMPD